MEGEWMHPMQTPPHVATSTGNGAQPRAPATHGRCARKTKGASTHAVPRTYARATFQAAPRAMTSRSHSRPAALSLTHDPTPQRTAPTAAELRESYHNRLDTEIDRALSAFEDLVASCQISDRTSNTRAEYQTQVEASSLAAAADQLLKLISELKLAVVTQNVSEVKAENRTLHAFMDKNSHEMLTQMLNLGDNIGKMLRVLEKNYYASCTTWFPNTESGPN